MTTLAEQVGRAPPTAPAMTEPEDYRIVVDRALRRAREVLGRAP